MRVLGTLAGFALFYAGVFKLFSDPGTGWQEATPDALAVISGVVLAVSVSSGASSDGKKMLKAFRRVAEGMADGNREQQRARALATVLCAGENGKVMFWQMLEHSPAGMREEPEMRAVLDMLSGWSRGGARVPSKDMGPLIEAAWVTYSSGVWRRAARVAVGLKASDPLSIVFDTKALSMLREHEMDLAEEMSDSWISSGEELAQAVRFLCEHSDATDATETP